MRVHTRARARAHTHTRTLTHTCACCAHTLTHTRTPPERQSPVLTRSHAAKRAGSSVRKAKSTTQLVAKKRTDSALGDAMDSVSSLVDDLPLGEVNGLLKVGLLGAVLVGGGGRRVEPQQQPGQPQGALLGNDASPTYSGLPPPPSCPPPAFPFVTHVVHSIMCCRALAA